jgi:hypothetical protein
MIQTDPFTSVQLSTAIRSIYLRTKKSKFKIGVNGVSKLTVGMVALAAVVVSNHDLFLLHRDPILSYIIKLKVSAWMQKATLTETSFMAEYHRAVKYIVNNSDEILKKLWDAVNKDSATTAMDTDEPLPLMVKLPIAKKSVE